MSKDLKNALRSKRDMDEYLEVRSTQEIIDDIKEVSTESTMRDHIAAVAMSGLCANPGGPFQADPTCGWSITNCTPLQVAEECYRLADAMLTARALSSSHRAENNEQEGQG